MIPAILLFFFSNYYYTFILGATDEYVWPNRIVVYIFSALVVWDLIYSILLTIANGIQYSFLGISIGHPAQVIKNVLHILCLFEYYYMEVLEEQNDKSASGYYFTVSQRRFAACVAMIFQYTQLLYWIKINSTYALYVRAFDRIASEIIPDLVFLTIFILEFANIFYILNMSREAKYEFFPDAPQG